MAILSFTTVLAGQSGNFIGGNVPRRIEIVSSDNLATVTAAGYLNNIVKASGNTIYPTDIIDMWYGYVSNSSPGTYEVFTASISGSGVITLVQWTNSGDVLLPVTSGDFAVFNGTTGQIKDAGYLPSNAAKTNVVMANGATIIAHIGTFTDTAGTLGIDAATAINGGNIQAGLSGTAGTLASFPSTAANGSLIISALNAGGAFNTTIRNSAMAQSTVYSIPDVGAATGFIVANATQGLMKSVTAAVVAGGNASQTVTDTFCTSSSTVVANWNTSTNAVTIEKVTPGNGSFVVLSSGDPGASTLGYIIMK
jgi:hypothetical protein